jgi:hypothetical protein
MDADLSSYRIEGIARMGDTPFSVPLITLVGNFEGGILDQGGCKSGLTVDYDVVVSLYPWEAYRVAAAHTVLVARLYDDINAVPEKQIFAVADFVHAQLDMGQRVLVHCQAGLNRSSLVVATYLVRHQGMTGDQAIKIVRQQRSPACLCNPTFEDFVRGLAPGENSA